MFRSSMESDTISLDSLFDDQTHAHTTEKMLSTTAVTINEIRPHAQTQSAPERQDNETHVNIEGGKGKTTISVRAASSAFKSAFVHFLTERHF